MTILEIHPNCPPTILAMAAEILACCDTDPAKRRAHRIQKLATFPEQYRDQVRETVTRVMAARNEKPFTPRASKK